MTSRHGALDRLLTIMAYKPVKADKSGRCTPAETSEPNVSGRSLATAAHEILEELIVTLQLPPGSLWSEEALSERIGIGRTPVREAIKRLQANDLIRILPRQGLMIAEIDLHEQIRIVDFRRMLELFVSVRAARRALADEREAIGGMADAIQVSAASKDVLAYLRRVFTVNAAVARAARNPLALRTIASVHALSRRFYFKYAADLNNLEQVASLHAARARAVASGDEYATERAATALMDVIEAYTKDIFSRTLR
jgi:DNA-binding GntR family transcriptional regulator